MAGFPFGPAWPLQGLQGMPAMGSAMGPGAPGALFGGLGNPLQLYGLPGAYSGLSAMIQQPQAGGLDASGMPLHLGAFPAKPAGSDLSGGSMSHGSGQLLQPGGVGLGLSGQQQASLLAGKAALQASMAPYLQAAQTFSAGGSAGQCAQAQATLQQQQRIKADDSALMPPPRPHAMATSSDGGPAASSLLAARQGSHASAGPSGSHGGGGCGDRQRGGGGSACTGGALAQQERCDWRDPAVVKQQLGEDTFYLVRSLLLAQQEQFVSQVYELHRLHRTQQLLAAQYGGGGASGAAGAGLDAAKVAAAQARASSLLRSRTLTGGSSGGGMGSLQALSSQAAAIVGKPQAGAAGAGAPGGGPPRNPAADRAAAHGAPPPGGVDGGSPDDNAVLPPRSPPQAPPAAVTPGLLGADGAVGAADWVSEPPAAARSIAAQVHLMRNLPASVRKAVSSPPEAAQAQQLDPRLYLRARNTVGFIQPQVSRRGLSGADIAFSGATTVQPEPQRQKQKQQQPAAVTGQLQAESKRRLSPPDAEAAAGAPLLPAVLRVPSAQGAQASDRQMPTEVAGPLQQLAPGSHSLATTVDAAAAASLHAAGLHAALAVSAPLMLSQPLAIAPSAQQAACPLPALLPMAPPATQPMLQQQPQLPAVSAPLLQPAAAFDPHAAWFKSHFQASVGGGGGAPLPSSPRQHQQHQQVFAGMAAPVGVLAGFGGVDDPMAAAAAARKQMQPWWKNKEATFGEVPDPDLAPTNSKPPSHKRAGAPQAAPQPHKKRSRHASGADSGPPRFSEEGSGRKSPETERDQLLLMQSAFKKVVPTRTRSKRGSNRHTHTESVCSERSAPSFNQDAAAGSRRPRRSAAGSAVAAGGGAGGAADREATGGAGQAASGVAGDGARGGGAGGNGGGDDTATAGAPSAGGQSTAKSAAGILVSMSNSFNASGV